MARTLTVNEAAKMLHITSYTVRLWLRQGKLRGRKIGRAYLILESDVEVFLNPETLQTPKTPKRVSAMGLLKHIPHSHRDFEISRQEEIELEEHRYI